MGSHLAVVGPCLLESLAQAADAVQHQTPDQVVLHGPEGGGQSVGMEQGRAVSPERLLVLWALGRLVLCQAEGSPQAGWWGNLEDKPQTQPVCSRVLETARGGFASVSKALSATNTDPLLSLTP